jgi:hypothetical protein
VASGRFFQGLRGEWRWYSLNEAGRANSSSDQATIFADGIGPRASRLTAMRAPGMSSAALLLSAAAVLSGCDNGARAAFEACTIGVSQASPRFADEQERRSQELAYAGACMFERGFVLDAERQRQDAATRRVRDAGSYWVRR